MFGAMSKVYLIIHRKESNQIINIKSLTESELVVVSRYIPYNLWLMMFLENQEYSKRDNNMLQVNMCTILMEKMNRKFVLGDQEILTFAVYLQNDRIDKA